MTRPPVHPALRFLFASDAPEQRRLSPAAQYALILALYLVTRLLTVYGFEMRHVDWLGNDPGGYVATANYIAAHGYMPTEDNILYRQYAGISLMMIPVNLLVHDMPTAGYIVVTLCGLASVLLIQHLFHDFRLSLLSVIFLPYWITTTSTIFSEAPTELCFLIALWAFLRGQTRPRLFLLAILLAGYALVVRQNAGIFVIPFIFIMGWKYPGGNFLRACALVALALIPIALYLTWNWLTIHQLFPQTKLHLESLRAEVAAHPDPSRYSTTLFDYPFHSLYAGLTDPSERIFKRLSVVATLLVVAAALACLAADIRREKLQPTGVLALAFTAAIGIHLLFLVSIGGDYGYKWLDRHLSQLNPALDWALFYQRPLRWPWIALLTLAGVIFAISTGVGTSFLFFK
jgi:hypothetical protein